MVQIGWPVTCLQTQLYPSEGNREKRKERNKSLFDKEQQRIKQYAQLDSRKPTKKTHHNKKKWTSKLQTVAWGMGDGDDYLLMSILKHSITSWRVRSFFPGCHLYKLEDNGSTGLHRGYKLLQIEQANMLHPCSAALIKTIKRSDRRGRKPTSRWFNCALLRQHLHSSQVSQHGCVGGSCTSNT